MELVEREAFLAEDVCDLPLAGVVTFGGTVPHQQPEVEWQGAIERLRRIGWSAVR